MIKNAKIVGVQVDPEAYHRRDVAIPRGHPEYVMSRGELVEFARCPHRWKAGYRDSESSDSQKWGSLIDTLLLDPVRFSDKYAIAPTTYMAEGKKKGDLQVEKVWNWNATACKEWREAQGGKAIIKADEKAAGDEAIKMLQTDPMIAELIFCSEKQVMVIGEWEDAPTGLHIPLRALIDLVPSKDYSAYALSLSDLKTCCLAEPRAWKVAVFKHDYHTQAALYLDLYNVATGESRTEFRHIVQESFPPYETGKRILSVEFIDLGRDKYAKALSLYCQCVKSNHWPTYEETEDYHIGGWGIVDPEGWMI